MKKDLEKNDLRAEFVSDIRNIITTARNNAIRSIDSERVKMYWKLGERIFNEEQHGNETGRIWNISNKKTCY